MRNPSGWNRTPMFEREFAELLRRYADEADQPFDAVAIAGAATAGPHVLPWDGRVRLFGTSLRAAWTFLLILGLLAIMVAGALVILDRVLPAPPPSQFAPEEILVTTFTNPTLTEFGPDYTLTIVAIDEGSGEARVVAEGEILAVSPDRTEFVRLAPGGVMVTAADRSDITALPTNLIAANYSPDGRYLLLAGDWDANVGTAGFVILDTETGEYRALPHFQGRSIYRASGARSLEGSWSPDSRHVLLPTQEGLIIFDLGGTLERRVPDTDEWSLGYWSPDGSSIVVEKVRSLTFLSVEADGEIELQETLPHARYPSWSPDGLHVAFLLDGDIAVLDRNGTGPPRIVFSGSAAVDGYIQWSPDGSQLAFHRYTYDFSAMSITAGLSELIVVDATGADPHVVFTREMNNAGPPRHPFVIADW